MIRTHKPGYERMEVFGLGVLKNRANNLIIWLFCLALDFITSLLQWSWHTERVGESVCVWVGESECAYVLEVLWYWSYAINWLRL